MPSESIGSESRGPIGSKTTIRHATCACPEFDRQQASVKGTDRKAETRLLPIDFPRRGDEVRGGGRCGLILRRCPTALHHLSRSRVPRGQRILGGDSRRLATPPAGGDAAIERILPATLLVLQPC